MLGAALAAGQCAAYAASLPAGVTAEASAFGSELVTLPNGLRVYMRYSDSHPGQIYLRGTSPGGQAAAYKPELTGELKTIDDFLGVAGAGELSSAELDTIQKRGGFKVSMSVDKFYEKMEMSAKRNNVADALALLMKRVTKPAKDVAAFDAMMQKKRKFAGRQTTLPIQVMGDSITSIVYSRHPLGGKVSMQNLATVDYDRVMEIVADRFGDCTDFTFYVTGDYDRDTMIPLLTEQLGKLPIKGRREKVTDVGYRFIEGEEEIPFTIGMKRPFAVTYQFRHTGCPYNLQNLLTASVAGNLMKRRLEHLQGHSTDWPYKVSTHASVTQPGATPPEFMMPVYVRTNPGEIASTEEFIEGVIAEMASGKVKGEEIEAIKKSMEKGIESNRGDNAYWLAALAAWNDLGLDLDSGYEEALSGINPESLARFITTYMPQRPNLRLRMTPAE